MAQDDITATREDTPVNISVLTDNGSGVDSFGDDGPNTGRIQLPGNTSTQGGILLVNDAVTPNDPTDDTVDYMPAANFNGSDSFEYTITDSNGDHDTATVTIDVAAINDVPVANDDIDNTRIDTALNLQPLLNDDFGGDGSSNGPITIITSPANGSATVNDNGTPDNPLDDSIDYLPDTNFSGTDKLTYQLCDADGNCAAANISIEVTDTNAVPTAQDDTISTDEDQAIDIMVLADNGNGADSFGDDGPSAGSIHLAETYSANGGELRLDDGRTANDPSDDRVHYTPPTNFNGSDSFTYTIADANGDSSSAQVSINVAAVNDLPQAQDDSVSVPEDSTSDILVLSNNGSGVDSFGGEGPNAGSILLPKTDTAQGGTVVVNDSGTATDPTDDTVTYTPAANFVGTDTFDYSISDANADTSTATVQVTVTPVDDLPLAKNDQFTIKPNTTVKLAVLADNGHGNDDFGGDGPGVNDLFLPDALSAQGASLTVNTAGTPNNPLDDTVTYVPLKDFNGIDSFNYIISDADGDISTATVTIISGSGNSVQVPTTGTWGLIILSILLSIVALGRRRTI